MDAPKAIKPSLNSFGSAFYALGCMGVALRPLVRNAAELLMSN